MLPALVSWNAGWGPPRWIACDPSPSTMMVRTAGPTLVYQVTTAPKFLRGHGRGICVTLGLAVAAPVAQERTCVRRAREGLTERITKSKDARHPSKERVGRTIKEDIAMNGG